MASLKERAKDAETLTKQRLGRLGRITKEEKIGKGTHTHQENPELNNLHERMSIGSSTNRGLVFPRLNDKNNADSLAPLEGQHGYQVARRNSRTATTELTACR